VQYAATLYSVESSGRSSSDLGAFVWCSFFMSLWRQSILSFRGPSDPCPLNLGAGSASKFLPPCLKACLGSWSRRSLISRGAVLPVGAVRISMPSDLEKMEGRNLEVGGAGRGSRPGPEGVPRSAMTLYERPRWGCLQFRGAPRVQHLCRPTTLALYPISRYVLTSERCLFPDFFRDRGLV
jgi:hypothetical protein